MCKPGYFINGIYDIIFAAFCSLVNSVVQFTNEIVVVISTDCPLLFYNSRKPTDKVIHLTLVAVRKRFQKYGIGKYLLTVRFALN